jgi:hypothetical protein
MPNEPEDILQRLAALEAALAQRSNLPSNSNLTERATPMDLHPYPAFYQVLPDAEHDFFRSPLSELKRRAFLSNLPFKR